MKYIVPLLIATLTVPSLAQSQEQQSEQPRRRIIQSAPKDVGLAPIGVGQRYYITLETTKTAGNSAVFSGATVEILVHGEGPWYRVRLVGDGQPAEPIWVNFNFVSTIQDEK